MASRKKAVPAAQKASPCKTCGACPECGRAPAPAVTPMPPVIIVHPVAPAPPVYVPVPYAFPQGPIWIAPEYPQWNPGWNTAGANPHPGTFIVTNTSVPGASDIGNGYRSIWGQGGVS